MNQFNLKKLAPLAFLACVLLFLVTVSALPTDVEPLVHTFDKRNKKCACTVANADFFDGPVKGLVTFVQDEYGSTTVTGIFSKGFEDKHAKYKFKLVDDCDNELHDLT